MSCRSCIISLPRRTLISKLPNITLGMKSSAGRSTHFGGLWEAAVKAAKCHLHKLLGTQTLTWEEHYSILTEVEATLNSRPLYPLVSIRHFIHIHIMYFSSFIARVSLRPPVYHRSLSHRCWQCRLHYFCIFCFCLVSCIIFQLITVLFSKPILRDTHGMP